MKGKEIVIVTYNHRNFYLPHEIVFNILSRLPVKPLLRFKSVCKSWRDLISSHQFIKYHLKRANRSNNFIFHKHMCFKVSHHEDISSTLSSECINFSTFERVTLDLPFEETFVDAKVLASCDGLLLIFRGDGVYFLWNPSTRACKPLLGLRRFNGEASYFRLYGICYDVANDAYKVINASRLDSHDDTIVAVYDCKTDLCTYITDFPYGIRFNSQGAHVNKTPHWLVYGKRSKEIIRFDSSEGVFKEVPKPARACNCYEWDLRVFEEKLCMVLHDFGTVSYVMVMEEYGVKESWTTLFVILMSLDAFDARPLGLAESGEVVIERRRVRVDLYDHQMFDYTFTNLLSYYNDEFMAATYVESLVPPGGFD